MKRWRLGLFSVFLYVLLASIGWVSALQVDEAFCYNAAASAAQGSSNVVKFSNWFTLKATATTNWDLTPDSQNSEKQFTLTLKGSQVTPETKKILVLFTRNSSSYDTAVDKILSIFLSKKVPAIFTAINIGDFKKDPEPGLKTLDYARSEKFDLIFSVGSDTTDFVYANFRNETIPLVTVTSKDPVLLGYLKDYETGSGTNVAYTSLNVEITTQMLYLKQLMPDIKNIAVMYSDDNKSAIQTQVEPLKNIAKENNINIIDVNVASAKTACADLFTKMPQAIAEINDTDPQHKNSIFWITGATQVFNEIKAINHLADTVPVLSAVPDVVKEGDDSAVLSIGVTFESNAHLAAIYATDILQGAAKPGDLKVGQVSPPDIAINFMKAKQIGLKIPFSFFESASFVYDYQGKLVRKEGQVVN